MRFDDGAADAKSHAGPVQFGCKKRLEDLLRPLDPRARQADGRRWYQRQRADRRRARDIGKGIAGVSEIGAGRRPIEQCASDHIVWGMMRLYDLHGLLKERERLTGIAPQQIYAAQIAEGLGGRLRVWRSDEVGQLFTGRVVGRASGTR